MGELGDVLALLHDSDSTWRVIRMRGTEWTDRQLNGVAFARGIPSRRGGRLFGKGKRHSISASLSVTARRADAPSEQVNGGDESFEMWSYWQEGDRRRAEYAVGDETVVVAYQGETYWSWSPSQGGRTNAGRDNESHGLGPAPALLDTAPLPGHLRLRVLGRDELLGRVVWRATAAPRPDRHLMDHMIKHRLGSGADEYRLAVDAERGVLLRVEAYLGGRPFRVIDVTEIAFDDELSAATFTIDLPEGETFDDTVDFQRTTIAGLQSLVPFRVFLPSHAPSRADVSVHRLREDGKHVMRAVITYTLSDRDYGLVWLNECAETDAYVDPVDGWRERGELRVIEQASDGYVRAKVRCVRDGTALHLESTAASLAELIELAESLIEGPRDEQ